MAKPRKGKAKEKVTASGKKVSYGQAGEARAAGHEYAPEPRRATHTALDH